MLDELSLNTKNLLLELNNFDDQLFIIMIYYGKKI